VVFILRPPPPPQSLRHLLLFVCCAQPAAAAAMDFLLHVVATAAAAAVFCLLAGCLNILMRFLEFYGKTGERRAGEQEEELNERKKTAPRPPYFLYCELRKDGAHTNTHMRTKRVCRIFLPALWPARHETVSLHSKKRNEMGI
jgi:hypothetical protein